MEYIEWTVPSDGELAEWVANLFTEEGSGGVVFLENPPRVRAYFPFDGNWSARSKRLKAALARLHSQADELMGLAGPVEEKRVEEADWANAWRAYYRPFLAGSRLVIVPAWQEYLAEPGKAVLRIDPGMAFGTGTHASTRLCLEAIETVIHPGDRVLDVGTGSGILAIAAALLGAGGVLAIDRDLVAVRVCGENVALNGLQDKVRVEEAVPAEVAEQSPGCFDLLLANLTADILLQVCGQLALCLSEGGRFILSGIIQEGLGPLRRELHHHGLQVDNTNESEGWYALVGHK